MHNVQMKMKDRIEGWGHEKHERIVGVDVELLTDAFRELVHGAQQSNIHLWMGDFRDSMALWNDQYVRLSERSNIAKAKKVIVRDSDLLRWQFAVTNTTKDTCFGIHQMHENSPYREKRAQEERNCRP